MSRLGVPEDAGAGFTLVEALAALAVMAAGLGAVAGLTSANLHATLNAQRHLADLEFARMIMAGLPDRSALPFGRLTGSLAARNWRIDASPVGKAVASGPKHLDSPGDRFAGSLPHRRDDRDRHDPFAQAGGAVRTAEIGASGFSLIEALAAVALTATILIAVSAIAGQWLPTWN